MSRQVLQGGRAPDAGRSDVARGGKPMPWLDPPAGPWTTERAYAYCEDFVQAHHEIYPVASRFVPAEKRRHLMAIYAFARSADDFADEPAYEGRRNEALARWEDELNHTTHNKTTHPKNNTQTNTNKRHDLP